MGCPAVNVLGVAIAVAREHTRARPASAPHYDDVLSDATFGVARALPDFDPTKGSLVGFLTQRARWACLDGSRKRSVIRWPARHAGDTPFIPPERRTPRSLDAIADAGLEVTGTCIEDDAADARVDATRLLAWLAPRDRFLLLATYGHGWRLKDVAAALGVSESMACRWRNDALAEARDLAAAA